MPYAMTCGIPAQHPRSRPRATARFSIQSTKRSMRYGHGLSASLAISRSSGALPLDMTNSPPASSDSSCSDASAFGLGLSTGPSANNTQNDLNPVDFVAGDPNQE